MKPQVISLLGFFLAFSSSEFVSAGVPVLKTPKAGQAANNGAITVRHFARSDGWYRAETANFRVYHNQSKTLAEKVARIAERTRRSEAKKWFGELPEDWKLRCDIILHASSRDYVHTSGVPAGTPGHSTTDLEAGRVVNRRIELHCDDPGLMVLTVLPHEVTHIVLGGQIGDKRVPRWADEGMAILSEPSVTVDEHRANLERCRQKRQLFHVRDLMQMTRYPEARYATAFYAQSVSLVEFLVNERGAPAFTQFLREAAKGGYEKSLRRHYGYVSFDELHRGWSRKVQAGGKKSPEESALAENR